MDGIKIPTKVEEALRDPWWTKAMEVEMEALQKNGTWSVESLPQGKRPVGCDDIEEMRRLQEHFFSEFEMKDLGGLKYFLGIEVAHSRDGMLGCKPAENPIMQNHHLAIYPNQVPANKEKYQRLVGRKHGHMETKGYTDADWARNITDRRYTILLTEIGFKPQGAMSFYCDDQVTREIANNAIQHDRTKHVEVDRHFINEKLDIRLIDIPYMRSEEQLADVLTHAVSARVFRDLLDKLGL
ncbi:uncharacterized protein [Pyrus communis]|uniref:uncharacterized protein n=1 Tax=Pyrus communis TaxID=23211 RepID=UPI0035C1CD94